MSSPEHDSARSALATGAQVAEIIASIAVVVTLLFLISEVRQNTRITQAAAYERRMEDLNDWRALMVTEPRVAELFMGYVRGGEVNEEELDGFRLGAYRAMQWAIYENAYFSNQRDLLGTSEWGRFEAQICATYDTDGDRWTTDTRRLLTEEFARFTEEACE